MNDSRSGKVAIYQEGDEVKCVYAVIGENFTIGTDPKNDIKLPRDAALTMARFIIENLGYERSF